MSLWRKFKGCVCKLSSIEWISVDSILEYGLGQMCRYVIDGVVKYTSGNITGTLC